MRGGVVSPISCKKTCSPSKPPLMSAHSVSGGRQRAPPAGRWGTQSWRGAAEGVLSFEPHHDHPHLRGTRTRRPRSLRERALLPPNAGGLSRAPGARWPPSPGVRTLGGGGQGLQGGADGDCVRTHSPTLGVAHDPHPCMPHSPLLWGPQYSRRKFLLGSVLYSPLKRGHPRCSRRLPDPQRLTPSCLHP